MGSSNSKINVPVWEIGMGLAAVAVITLIYHYQDQNESRPTVGNRDVLGLQNVGNTCYLNSLLQALGACNKFTNYLSVKNNINQLISTHRFLTRTGPLSTPIVEDEEKPRLRGRYGGEPPEFWPVKDALNPMVTCLTKALAIINREVFGKDSELSELIPLEIMECFADKNYFTFARNQEQDSFEIFNMLMKEVADQSHIANLYLETIRILLSTKTSDEQNNLYPNPIGGAGDSIEPRIYVPMSPTDIRNPFNCSIATQLCCMSCGTSNPVRFEEANCISVSLPSFPNYWGRITLQDLINDTLKVEFVDSVDCETCGQRAGRPAKCRFVKKTLIARMPSTLCVHIHRSMWDTTSFSGVVKKRMDFVEFPERLDLRRTATLGNLMLITQLERQVSRSSSDLFKSVKNEHAQRATKSIFDLKSVICHSGDTDGGHFTTMRKCSHQDRRSEWYCISDTLVVPVDFDIVKRSTAYILYYETIAPDTES